MNITLGANERLIPMTDPAIRLTGRIDTSNPEQPFFIYPCSSAALRLTGRTLRVMLTNQHSYFDNRLGVIINGVQSAVLLEKGEQVLDLSDRLTDGVNDVLLFKRQDCCHAYRMQGIVIAADAQLLPLPARLARRMEVYGDSVSAGEVSEAEFACAQPDPEGHNGLYSNSWLSYSWQTARLLNAELHDIATGGMALLDGTGYFYGPDYIGMLSSWDKINYYPPFGEPTPWDFARYTPHVVIVAIGQNDHNPVNIMADDYNGEAADHWRAEYRRFIGLIREKYPRAHIVLTTTILGHHENWDKAIDAVCEDVRRTDERVHHFLYTNNGCGTPGHIRGSEAAVMAKELAAFIETLPGVWEE
ncbi:MAG: electron transporter RnfD [Clostridia bacterium]|nr:electron transporter RnfD [Clostridia bacterium]